MPRPVKPAHYRGTYHVRSRAVVATAKANPATRCWRCNRTLAEHPPTKKGKPPRWSAGHINAGQVNGPLLPEVLSCNASHGATMGNQRRGQRRTTERTWT